MLELQFDMFTKSTWIHKREIQSGFDFNVLMQYYVSTLDEEQE